MTALCGGGVSGPKAGVAETVIFTTSALASIFNNKGGAWATLVAPLLGVLAYNATELCEVDPPADPGMTAEDYLHLLKLDDLAGVATATAKLVDLAKIAIWYDLCECKTVGTPAIPSAILSPPTGLGSPQPTLTTPCWSTVQQLMATPTDGTIRPEEIYNQILPPGALVTIDRNSPHTDHTARVVDSSWTSFRVRAAVDAGAPTDAVFQFYLVPFNSLGPNNLAPFCVADVDNISGSLRPMERIVTGTMPAGTLYLAAQLTEQLSSTPYPVTVELEIFCGGAGGSVGAPCLPDPGTTALLHQIYQLLQLIQRQHVPFAYVPGLTYADRTGSGEIAFTDPIVRLQVDLTDLPASLGYAEGAPDALFDAGFVSLGTADGYERAHRISTTPFLLQVPGDVTTIGYTLAPGVVATFRTFSREP